MAALRESGGLPDLERGNRIDNDRLRDYIFLLEERLSYALSHLTTANFSDAGLKELLTLANQQGSTIDDVVKGASLLEQKSADVLNVRLNDGDNNVTTLKATAEGVTIAIAHPGGDGVITIDKNGVDLRGLSLTIRDGDGEILLSDGEIRLNGTIL